MVTLGSYTCSTATPGTSWGQSQILCLIPPGQGANLSVVVTVGGLSNSNPPLFSYQPPLISSLNPANGPTLGGGVLTVYGSNFGLSATVTFVGSAGAPHYLTCAPYGLGQSHTQIQCTIPPFQGTAIPVYVNVSGQLSASRPYSYNPPVISAISPLTGPTQGGVAVTLTGSNFGTNGSNFGAPNYALSFASTSVSSANVTQTALAFLLPAGTGGGVPLSLSIAGQAASYAGAAFQYSPPNITSVGGCSPLSGSINCATASATLLTISGSNFGATVASPVTVTVNGADCSGVSMSVPHTQLQCSMPANPTGGYNLPLVVTVNGQSGTSNCISFAGPVIAPHSLVASSAAQVSGNGSFTTVGSTGALQLPSDSSQPTPFNVTLFGQYWGSSASSLWIAFGPAGSSVRPFNCSVYAASIYYSASASLASCAVPDGVGANLTFVVHAGLLASQESADTLTYPAPTILSHSLRIGGLGAGSSCSTNNGSNVTVGLSSQGDSVCFDVRHVGTSVALLSVYYGQGGVWPTLCSQLLIGSRSPSTGTTTLSCVTAPGSGTGYTFRVLALNSWSAAGTDVYNYITPPIVYRVRGCVDNSTTNSTSQCPTVGGSLLTIDGDLFAAGVSVSIGSLSCTAVSVLSVGQLTCLTPAQAGSAMSVIVTNGLKYSAAVYLLSYAPATLSSISPLSGACVFLFSAVANCSRMGGDGVTLQGTNFGPASPTVLIDGAPCTSVNLLSDSSLTCLIPSGTQTQRSVIFISAGRLPHHRALLCVRVLPAVLPWSVRSHRQPDLRLVRAGPVRRRVGSDRL